MGCVYVACDSSEMYIYMHETHQPIQRGTGIRTAIKRERRRTSIRDIYIVNFGVPPWFLEKGHVYSEDDHTWVAEKCGGGVD